MKPSKGKFRRVIGHVLPLAYDFVQNRVVTLNTEWAAAHGWIAAVGRPLTDAYKIPSGKFGARA